MEEKERLTIEFFATIGDFAGVFDPVCDWFRGDKSANYGELMLLLIKKSNSVSQILEKCVEGNCEMQNIKNALNILEQRIPAHNCWYHNEYRDGFGVRLDGYDNEVTISDEVMSKAMEDNLRKSIKKLFAIIEQPEIEQRSRIFKAQSDNFILDDEIMAKVESERRDTATPRIAQPSIEPQPTPNPINNAERHNSYYNLTSFIDGSVDSVTYMMEHKQPKDGVRLLWKSDKGDAQLFRTILSWDIPSINKCIRFKSGKQLTHGDKLSKRGGNPFLRKILQGLK